MTQKIKCEICGKEFEHELTKDGIVPNIFINSLIKFYNKHHTFKITLSPVRLYRVLFSFYDEEIDYLLSYGYHSTEEYTFFQVLIFYFGYTHVKMGKRLYKANAKT